MIAALDALYWSRTSQGAIGWGIILLTMPAISFPLYLFLGRSKFRGHKKSIRRKIDSHRSQIRDNKSKTGISPNSLSTPEEKVFENLSESQFIDGNKTRILKDGTDSFAALFASIREAKTIILLQYYTVRDDNIGNQLKELLLEKATQGVKVYFMYDAWGSSFLSSSFIEQLNQENCQMRPFEIRHKLRNFFQLNFRNHRKLAIIDGKIGYVGGLNIGDEYLVQEGENYWRDTQLEIIGPAVLALQASFVADWFWATGASLEVNWEGNIEGAGNQRVLPILTGPSDTRENCSFLFMQAILSAKKRVWISTPYFVPDDELLKSLQLASIRGVEVIVLLPQTADHYLPWLASFAYIQEAIKYGVKIYHYIPGFLHQKAFLIDDEFAAIGSANLDNRSVRLNFEVTILVSSKQFTNEVAKLFEIDMSSSKLLNADDLSKFSIPMKAAIRFAKLFSPIL